MITVHLNSADTGQGEWLTFPVLMDGGMPVLDAGYGAASIAAADSGYGCLDRHLAGKTVRQGKGLMELDFLALRMEGLPAEKQQIFLAALDIENPGSLAEMVNLSCNLDKFALYEGADTEEKLGEYVLKKDYKELPCTLADLLDVESIGRKYAQGHAGRFAPSGYVARTGVSIAPVYDGGELPDPLYDMESVFEVELYGNKDRFTLFLPATENQMECASGRMRLESMEGRTGFYVKEKMEGLTSRLPCGCSIRDLNDFARFFKAQGFGQTAETRERLLAALEAEAPVTMEQAIRAAGRLEDYSIFMHTEEYGGPEGFARRMLQDGGRYHVDDFTAAFVDFPALGKAMMEEMGAVQTAFGIVINRAKPLCPLPGELTDFRLFSPLVGRMYGGEEDPGNDGERLWGEELCGYRELILAAVEKDTGYLDKERGLAEYLDHALLNRKVHSMFPTVEEWEGKLWGVLEVRAYGTLSEGEMRELKDAWTGQESDGWGEGFEQREIRTEEGDLCVSFWNPEGGFFIKTEQELKQWQTQDQGMQMGGIG